MNALQQYIDLFTTNRALIDEGSSHVVNSLRQEALEILSEAKLPQKGSENYETIDLAKILSPDYGINLARINLDVNALMPFRCGIPNLTSALFFLQNDIYREAKDARKNFPEGLYVNSLRQFCNDFPELAERYYGKVADIRNPLVALNTMLVQDGIVIWVKEGVKVTFPIQIVSILENSNPLMALRRLLIIAEKDSEVKILACDHTQKENLMFVNLQTIEVFADQDSNVEIYEMEESSEQTCRLSSMYVRQGESSKVSAVGVTLYNGITRNEYFCSQSGKHTELQLGGMAIEDCKRQIDTYSVVEHTMPECHTDELFKYVVDDEATGTFNGIIKVQKGADKTEAFQSSRNIIGSEGARVYSKPRLEIYDDDVKCSHGCAIGQLDQKQIFYMRTRGLTEDEAKFLLKQAFMADIIDRISLQEFRQRLHTLVERRFAGEARNCTSCRSNCLGND